MIKKNHTLIVLLIVFVALGISACGGESEGVDQPKVRLEIGDTSIDGDVYSYCWPSTEDNWVCDWNESARAEPEKSAGVKPGDEVRFVIPEPKGTINKFTATVLDEQGNVQDFGSNTEGIFNAELPDGAYRVQVDVEYADVEGIDTVPANYQPYVSYVFELDIAGILAALPTATPTHTSTPTDTPTVTPTSTNTTTPTVTNTPTPEPTDTPTATPLPTDTPIPTEEATQEPTEEVTEAATEEAPDESAANIQSPTTPAVGDLGEKAIGGSVRVNDNGTLVPLAGVPVSYTHSSMANPDRASTGSTTTDADGAFAFDPIFLHDTDSVMVSVQVPGFVPQTVQRGGYEAYSTPLFDFVLTSLGDSAPQATTPASIAPTPTDILPENVPPLSINFGGREYKPVGYQYCERRQPGGERVCVDLPAADTPTVRRITFLRGSAAQLVIGGERPTEIQIEYLTDTGVPTGQPEVRPGDNIILYTITPEAGNYIMAVRVSWGLRDATYYFRVAVTS